MEPMLLHAIRVLHNPTSVILSSDFCIVFLLQPLILLRVLLAS